MAQQLSLREKALVESERNYRDIFNTTKDAIFLHDAESGNIVEINKTMEEMFGYSREEILDQPVQALSPGEPLHSSRDAREWIHKAFQEGSQYFEWLAKKKNGDLFWTEVVLSATQISGARCVLAVVRDITDRKRVEEALRDAALLPEQNPNPTLRVSRDGMLLFANPASKKLLTEWQTEIGKMVPDFVRQIVEQSLTDSVSKELEISSSGRELTFIVRPIPDLDYANFYGHDITERKQAEEALRERSAWINAILEASPSAIYAMDKEGIVLSWNKAAERIFGGSKEETIGRLLPYVPEEKLEELRVNLNKILREEPFLGVELLRRKKDGSPIDISMSAAPLYDSSGAVKGIMAIATDITQQKKMEAEHGALENQLRQAQKMEAIGQLGGGIAHDFNNILSAIVGYSHLSLMKMSPDDPNRYNIEQILASSERATTLTQRLLAFSRKQTMNLARVDLNDIIAKFEQFLLHLLREDIELKTTLAPMELPVMADRGQMEQVLMNLVTNSRDAMPQGGRISIETGLVELDQSFLKAHGFGWEGGYVLLSVTDTGMGIPETIKDKIFEPFFTTKEEGKGTGLGLSMVYGIVKKHEGYITVYSQVGIGTTFNVYLPVAPVAIKAQEQKIDEQHSVRGGTETVLIAEDDSSVRALTANLLRHFGYTVIEAVDGLEAVAKFTAKRDSIHLVILDGIMPKMNGKEAWKEIKALSSGVKAIFISGYAEDIFTKDGIPDGEALFIQKPSPPLVLVKRVREMLDK
jgi:PAS domain S-box-containing protein